MIGKFRFSLRSVATLRAHKELAAREALAAAIRECAAVETRLDAAILRLAEMEKWRTAGRASHFRPADEVSFLHAYRSERTCESEIRKQLAAAVSSVEARRVACVEANREVKAIERLESAARSAHVTASLRAEQIEIDEMAGRRSADLMPTQT